MMKKAKNAARKINKKLKVLGVTVLTSFNANSIKKIGHTKNINKIVIQQAKLAKSAGLDGIVCSPSEVKHIKSKFGKELLAVTPGIRPLGSDGDQKRVESIKGALSNGSDFIVVGRPITKTPNPVKSVVEILEEINS